MNKNKNENLKEYLDIIDEIEIVRNHNNVNWMDVLRLAFKNSPDDAKKLLLKINNSDQQISSLIQKLHRREGCFPEWRYRSSVHSASGSPRIVFVQRVSVWQTG